MNSKSQEYIIGQLELLAEMFDEITIRYEYRESGKTHIVEVLPFELFNGKESYRKAEICIENYFENTFPGEEILFVSSKSLTQIENPTLSISAKKRKFNFSASSGLLMFNIAQDSQNNSYALAA